MTFAAYILIGLVIMVGSTFVSVLQADAAGAPPLRTKKAFASFAACTILVIAIGALVWPLYLGLRIAMS